MNVDMSFHLSLLWAFILFWTQTPPPLHKPSAAALLNRPRRTPIRYSVDPPPASWCPWPRRLSPILKPKINSSPWRWIVISYAQSSINFGLGIGHEVIDMKTVSLGAELLGVIGLFVFMAILISAVSFSGIWAASFSLRVTDFSMIWNWMISRLYKPRSSQLMIKEMFSADTENLIVLQIQIAIESFGEHHVWASNGVKRLGCGDGSEEVKARNQS